jgi:hypothetical protein
MLTVFFDLTQCYIVKYSYFYGYVVGQLVEAVFYTPEGRGFYSQCDHWIVSIYLILLAALGPEVH